MAEQRSGRTENRWNWEVTGFDQPRKWSEPEDHYQRPSPPLVRRYSVSTSSVSPHSEPSKHAFSSKLLKLKDKVKHVREDYLELRQEAIDLQEYSNAKIDRLTRYLGVLADKTRNLDQAALETEARISPLIYEKKKLFNDLLTAKGSIKVFCRVRPLFEDEGPSVVEFPDDCTVRVNTCDDSVSNPKKDFEFDWVYGPHIAQAELFVDVQPFVQSAFDGYNVSIFAYGQTRSGKTHTMEGSNSVGVDLAGSESSTTEDDNGEHVTAYFGRCFGFFDFQEENSSSWKFCSNKITCRLARGKLKDFGDC